MTTTEAGEGEVRLFDIAAVLLRNWKEIARDTLIIAAVMIGIWLLIPKNYAARTVLLLPPEAADTRAQLSTQLPAGVRSLVGSAPNARQQVVSAVLGSASLAKAVVAQVARESRDSLETADRVGKILLERRTIQTNKDGTFTIEIRDHDPAFAAKVANAHAPLVNAIISQVVSEAASHRRRFLERQVDSAAIALTQSEQQLKNFQLKTDAPDVREQAQQTVQAASTLQQEIFAREVALVRLRATLAPNHPRVQAAQAELNAWRAQLQRLVASGPGGSQVLLPLRSAAEIQMGAARVGRDYEKNEQIFIGLTTALAQAQIDARNDMPAVSVLDVAEPPTFPAAAGKKIVFLASALIGFVITAGYVLGREYMRAARLQSANGAFFESWDTFGRELRRILRRSK